MDLAQPVAPCLGDEDSTAVQPRQKARVQEASSPQSSGYKFYTHAEAPATVGPCTVMVPPSTTSSPPFALERASQVALRLSSSEIVAALDEAAAPTADDQTSGQPVAAASSICATPDSLVQKNALGPTCRPTSSDAIKRCRAALSSLRNVASRSCVDQDEACTVTREQVLTTPAAQMTGTQALELEEASTVREMTPPTSQDRLERVSGEALRI